MTGLIARLIGQPEPHYTESLYDPQWNKECIDGRFRIFARPGGNLYFVGLRHDLSDPSPATLTGEYVALYAIRVKLKQPSPPVTRGNGPSLVSLLNLEGPLTGETRMTNPDEKEETTNTPPTQVPPGDLADAVGSPPKETEDDDEDDDGLGETGDDDEDADE